MCLQIIDHINHIIHPQEMTEVTAEIIRDRTCSIGQNIFHIACIQEMIKISSQSRAAILLFTRLSLPVEQDYIMCLALEEIVAIIRIGIPAVSSILDNINAFMKNNKGVGIRMGMIPRMTAFHSKHRSILFPRSTHGGPTEIRE